VYIVALREILPEVPATAFFASKRGSSNEQSDCHEAGHAAQFAIAGSGSTAS
jgi:hypothetical protein